MQQARFVLVLGSALSLLVFLSGCYSRHTTDRQSPTPAAKKMITGPVNYVALGDSTGSGVGAREGGYVARLFTRILAKKAGSRLTNLCVSGSTTADVLHYQLEAAIRANPNLITLGIGINDIGHGFSSEQFSKNYDQILTGLKKTDATIVVTNIPDISTAPRIPVGARSQYHQLIVEFNQKLEAIAEQHEVTLFDVYTLTHDQLPSHPEYFSADGFHPSDRGYQLWADQMWQAVAGIIGVEP